MHVNNFAAPDNQFSSLAPSGNGDQFRRYIRPCFE